jgi:hypothetical protein
MSETRFEAASDGKRGSKIRADPLKVVESRASRVAYRPLFSSQSLLGDQHSAKSLEKL